MLAFPMGAAAAGEADGGDVCTLQAAGRCDIVCRTGDFISVQIVGPGILADAHLDCGFAGAQCGAAVLLACSDTSDDPAAFGDIQPCVATGFFVSVICSTG